MDQYQACLVNFLAHLLALNATNTQNVTLYVGFRGKQIRLAVSITICARNAWMNIIGNPVKPTIRESAIGAINKRIICTPAGILKRGATGGFMKYVNPVLMPSGRDGKKKMKKDFEAWCHCRGLNVA
ncbi:TPA: hypothetical protein U2I15_001145 [Citrobacter koseri]|nr:hypothetical protein [Citrobacter koseri]HCR9746020.1 hypothetical protein [Citrobacter koseri]HEM6684865.1 hypothetical protein [Citrobacter koseri]